MNEQHTIPEQRARTKRDRRHRVGRRHRRHRVTVSVALSVTAVGCGGGPSAPVWESGEATATLSLDDGTIITFEGGTCTRGSTSTGKDSFNLSIGEPGSDGEGANIGIGLDLTGGATFPGDGSGNGVGVDHGGGRWGLAEGLESLRFNDDLSGGIADLAGKKKLGGFVDPRLGTIEFVC